MEIQNINNINMGLLIKLSIWYGLKHCCSCREEGNVRDRIHLAPRTSFSAHHIIKITLTLKNRKGNLRPGRFVSIPKSQRVRDSRSDGVWEGGGEFKF